MPFLFFLPSKTILRTINITDCQKCSNQSDKRSEWQASPARPTRTLHAGFVMQIKMEPDMLFVHFPFKKSTLNASHVPRFGS